MISIKKKEILKRKKKISNVWNVVIRWRTQLNANLFNKFTFEFGMIVLNNRGGKNSDKINIFESLFVSKWMDENMRKILELKWLHSYPISEIFIIYHARDEKPHKVCAQFIFLSYWKRNSIFMRYMDFFQQT